jgi:hypothetical protein
MLLSVLVTVICICMGVGAAALGGYPLYLGLLAGWLCLPAVVAIVLLPRLVMNKIIAARHKRTAHPTSDLAQQIRHDRKHRKESFFVN